MADKKAGKVRVTYSDEQKEAYAKQYNGTKASADAIKAAGGPGKQTLDNWKSPKTAKPALNKVKRSTNKLAQVQATYRIMASEDFKLLPATIQTAITEQYHRLMTQS